MSSQTLASPANDGSELLGAGVRCSSRRKQKLSYRDTLMAESIVDSEDGVNNGDVQVSQNNNSIRESSESSLELFKSTTGSPMKKLMASVKINKKGSSGGSKGKRGARRPLNIKSTPIMIDNSDGSCQKQQEPSSTGYYKRSLQDMPGFRGRVRRSAGSDVVSNDTTGSLADSNGSTDHHVMMEIKAEIVSNDSIGSNDSMQIMMTHDDPEEESDEYKLRRQKNNEAVKKSRQKARQKLHDTMDTISNFEALNTKLEDKIDLLSKEVKFLRSMYSSHIMKHGLILREGEIICSADEQSKRALQTVIQL